MSPATGQPRNACASGALSFLDWKENQTQTVVTRHRSPNYGDPYVANGAISMHLLDWMGRKTRDSYGPILSTSPGVCHALQGVTGKKSRGRHSLAVSEHHPEDFAGRRGGGSEPRPGTDLKAGWAWQRPSSPGNCRVTFDTTCVIRKVGHAVRGRFSGLQSPSGPPKAFGSYPSGRP